jgi:hypothetical protein
MVLEKKAIDRTQKGAKGPLRKTTLAPVQESPVDVTDKVEEESLKRKTYVNSLLQKAHQEAFDCFTHIHREIHTGQASTDRKLQDAAKSLQQVSKDLKEDLAHLQKFAADLGSIVKRENRLMLAWSELEVLGKECQLASFERLHKEVALAESQADQSIA